MSRLVSVAVPVPALDALTYRVPDGLDVPAVGARVLVPLGARRLTGIVVSAAAARGGGAEGAAIKDLIDVLDAAPFLPASVVELGQWVSEYYACGPGEAIGAAMPPFAWVESEWRVRITPAGEARLAARARPGLPTLRDRILADLSGGAWSPLRAIAYRIEHAAGGRRPKAVPARAAVRSLQAEGWVEVEEVLGGRADAFKTVRVAAITEDGSRALGTDSGEPGLGPRQRAALATLAADPAGVSLPRLREGGVSADVIDRLQGRGLVEVRRETGRPRSLRGRGDRSGLACGRRHPVAHRGTGRRLRPAAGSGCRARLRHRPPAWRHRQRQDRDLPPPGGRSPGCREVRPGTRSRKSA